MPTYFIAFLMGESISLFVLYLYDELWNEHFYLMHFYLMLLYQMHFYTLGLVITNNF